ncbi:MAG TPA: AbrB/MazE/SpoVT family DNA-binding domain-containing protein [Limnochordia bacterium]
MTEERDVIRLRPRGPGERPGGTIVVQVVDGQLQLPAQVCRALDLMPGDAVEFSLEGDHLVLRRAGPRGSL